MTLRFAAVAAPLAAAPQLRQRWGDADSCSADVRSCNDQNAVRAIPIPHSRWYFNILTRKLCEHNKSKIPALLLQNIYYARCRSGYVLFYLCSCLFIDMIVGCSQKPARKHHGVPRVGMDVQFDTYALRF
eukprot:3343192-Pleurochrysis_carterae.AAC.1